MKKTNLLLILILLLNAVILWNVCCSNSGCTDNAECKSNTECSSEKSCTAKDSICTETTCCKGDKNKCCKDEKGECCKYGEPISACCNSKKGKCSEKCEKSEGKKHEKMKLQWMKEELGLTDEQMKTLKADKEATKAKVMALKAAHEAVMMDMLNDEQKQLMREMKVDHHNHNEKAEDVRGENSESEENG